MSFGLIRRGAALFRIWFLQMFRPGDPNQDGHENRGQNRVAGVVGQPNRKKAKHQGIRFFPIPEILVQEINEDNQDRNEQRLGSFHAGSRFQAGVSAARLILGRKGEKVGVGRDVEDTVGSHGR